MSDRYFLRTSIRMPVFEPYGEHEVAEELFSPHFFSRAELRKRPDALDKFCSAPLDLIRAPADWSKGRCLDLRCPPPAAGGESVVEMATGPLKVRITLLLRDAVDGQIRELPEAFVDRVVLVEPDAEGIVPSQLPRPCFP